MKKFLILTVVIIALVSSAGYAYFILTVHPVIKNRIYRSAQLSDNNLDRNFKKIHFKSIINLRGKDEKEDWYQKESAITKKNNAELYNVRLSAYEFPISTEIDKLVHIFQTADGPILLHCQAGVDRSGLASALALSIFKDADLPEMEEQISWKYFVNPFRKNSTGKLFFSAYESYLQKKGIPHNRKNLLFWIDHTYIDYKGNIEFSIDLIGKKRFNKSKNRDRRSATVQKGMGNAQLVGWAFDRRRKQPVKQLGLSMDGATYVSARFVSERPDVAAYYQLEEKDFDNFKFGFIADIDTSHLSSGCHPISLRVGEIGDSDRIIKDSRFDLCIK